jgi:hypothetical protein
VGRAREWAAPELWAAQSSVGARIVGRSGDPGRPSRPLGFPEIGFLLSFFIELGIDSKMYISRLVNANDVVPILLVS